MAEPDSNLDCTEFRLLATILPWVGGCIEFMILAGKWAFRERQHILDRVNLSRAGHPLLSMTAACSCPSSPVSQAAIICVCICVLLKKKISSTCNIREKFRECLGPCGDPQHQAQGLARSRCSINICEMNMASHPPYVNLCKGVLHVFSPSLAAVYMLCLKGHVAPAGRLRLR